MPQLQLSDGTVRRVSTKYSFTGDVLATKETVVVPAQGGMPAAEHSLVTSYTRDPRGRVLSCSRVLDGEEALDSVSYTYDELGRLTGKNVGSAGSPVLHTSLACDLHGWTTGISVAIKEGPGNNLSTVFSETQRYADEGKDAGARRFDGNISETVFSHRVVPASGSPGLQANTWSYAYDGMKRLTGAGHYVGASSTPSLTDTERGITYDRNGNITHLKRYGSTGLENDLEFTHEGNRMTSLSDANATGSASGSKSFTYDENGNLTSDGRKGLQFSWNVLNLVSGATAPDGSSLKYSWLSDGTKVSASEDDGKGNVIKRHYVGSFVFVEDPVSGEWVKESVAWDEGRIFFDVPFIVDSTVVDDPLVEDRCYRDCWYATDHLGNVRVVIDITPGQGAPVVLEQSDYLPFGTRIQNAAHASMQANRWRYAGKEEQAFGSLNLGLLDFGARMYDPFTARWTAVDPMASAYYPTTPYSYCASNPISIQDPEGKAIETLWDIASIAIGLQNIKTNIKQGKVGAAVLDGVGIVVDAAAAVAPFIPGGVGAGIKAIRAGEKAAAAVKGADKATDATKAFSIATTTERGLVNEAKTLDKLGEVKNTKSFTVTIGGKDVTTIPDINTSKQLGEIKDTKAVYNSRQIKAEREAAKSQGKDFKIYTGTKTHVSRNIPESEIVRLEWLGPQ